MLSDFSKSRDKMEALVRIDQSVINVVERALFAARTKLGISYPKAMAYCLSITIFVMAFGTFISPSSLLSVKVPLLCLYAVLAYILGRTALRNYSEFHYTWNEAIERIITRDAIGNRERFRVMRGIFALMAFVFVSMSLTISIKLLSIGETSAIETARDVFSRLSGFPMLLTYQYLMCARPSVHQSTNS
jgi:hypothetical protein